MQLETPMPVYDAVETRSRILISAELIAYAVLLVLALVLRVVSLGGVPLMPSETHNALAAWRMVSPNAAGVDLIASSAIVFDAQSVGFALLGGSEFAARIGTVIAGVLVVLLPALFRSTLGKTNAFLLSILLALSPVLLVASRSSSADVWALLFAGLSLWGYWQAAITRQSGYAIFAVSTFAALIFLCGGSGIVLALILVVAALLTIGWQRRSDPLEDAPEINPVAPLRASSGLAVAVAVLVVLAAATGFLLYPAGLSVVGVSLGDAVRAVVQPQGITGYASLISLFYNPFIWVLAIAGLIARRDRLSVLDRFLLLWVIVGIVASLFVVDGDPGHALWIALPLMVLAARALEQALAPDVSTIFVPAPAWARWLVAISAVGVFCVFTIAFQSVGRSLVLSPDATFGSASFERDSVVLVLIALLFLVIGFFLFASLWGNRAAWQGLGIGLAIFGGLTALGGGWSAAVTNADNPVIFWHTTATHSDTVLLRQTLFDVSDRVSGGMPAMPVTVVAPEDGVVAWLLRDFDNTDFITDLNDAVGDGVVLLPSTVADPALGASYVGQDFVISRVWDIGTMSPVDLPGWWTQAQARTIWTGETRYNLWLRQDVYEGITPDQGVG